MSHVCKMKRADKEWHSRGDVMMHEISAVTIFDMQVSAIFTLLNLAALLSIVNHFSSSSWHTKQKIIPHFINTDSRTSKKSNFSLFTFNLHLDENYMLAHKYVYHQLSIRSKRGAKSQKDMRVEFERM